MTHLLYLYQSEPHDGAELRHSLRSVEKHLHLPDLTVTVVGDRPAWLTGVNHVPAENIHSTKAANMAYKTWLGCCELEGVPEQVFYMEDDYILLHEQSSVEAVYWGDLAVHIREVERFHRRGFWMSEAMRASLRYLGDHPAPQSWEVHLPTPVVPADARPLIEPLARTGYPALARSVWGTLTLTGQPGRDFRYEGTEPARSSATAPAWVSTDDVVPRRIAEALPEPSRWEKS